MSQNYEPNLKRKSFVFHLEQANELIKASPKNTVYLKRASPSGAANHTECHEKAKSTLKL